MIKPVYVHTPSAEEKEELIAFLTDMGYQFSAEELRNSPFPTTVMTDEHRAEAVPRVFIAAAVSDHMITLNQFKKDTHNY